MDEVRVWVISLVSITIILTLIEKLAPEGNLARYVRLICGLVVVVVISAPVVRFLNGRFELKEIAWKDYAEISEGEMRRRIERLEKEDSKHLLVLYRESLASDIKTRYKGEAGFEIIDVDTVLQEDYRREDYGAIRELYVKVGPPPGNTGASFGRESEDRLAAELSQTFGVDRSRVLIDSSRFKGR
jgi:stage III sporulation protein AF